MYSKNRYDKGRSCKSYNIGEKVHFFTPIRKVGLSEKLLHRWLGPYRVTAILSPNVYRIKTVYPPNKEETVNISRLKPFVERASDTDSSDDEATIILPNKPIEALGTSNNANDNN